MKLDKTNVCVFIENEAKLQEAREFLERYNEPIANVSSFSASVLKNWNYLMFSNTFGDWWLGLRKDNLITLSELEEILKGGKDD